MSFSGILWCMYRALERHAEIVPLGRPYYPTRFRDFVRRREDKRLYNKSLNGNPNAYWDRFRSEVENQLTRKKCDLIFAPVASRELCKVEFKQPLIYASDATFRLVKSTYNYKLSPEQVVEFEAAEQAAIRRATGLVYSSNWAADSAVHDYGASREKIRVIPFGANLIKVLDADQTREKIGRLPWKMLFIGMEWHRKGGDIAVEAIEILNKQGVPVELTMIGCEPPQKIDLPNVRIIRFIDKRRERGRRAFRKLLSESHFLILPSRADCSPVALCEAAAFGVPVVASDVGGVRSVVTEFSGRLLPSNSLAKDYAAAIIEMTVNEQRYAELVRTSRERYEQVLNWDKWAQSLLRFCHEFV